MTIQELIDKLPEFNPELEVVFADAWGQTWPVNSIVIDYLTNIETDEETIYLVLTDQELKDEEPA